MIVPHNSLRPETLAAMIEEFVTRDGAVHGHTDISIERKIAGVMQRLELRLAVIVYDESDESYSIVPTESARIDRQVEGIDD